MVKSADANSDNTNYGTQVHIAELITHRAVCRYHGAMGASY